MHQRRHSLDVAHVVHLLFLLELSGFYPQLVFQFFWQRQHPVYKPEQFQNLRPLVASPVQATNRPRFRNAGKYRASTCFQGES